MRVFYCDHHAVPLPPEHPFPMEKYAALRRALVAEGVLSADELRPAPAVARELLEAVHARDWVERFLAGQLDAAEVRRIGFPWSPALVARSLASVGGTVAAARAALAGGRGTVAGNLAGGTHHAHAAFGAGYCVFNDVAVASRALLDAGEIERVLVFDVDVHQGDGTAAIFADDARVFTCSLHGARNFPARKARSDLDVELADGTADEAYLRCVAESLEQALARARPDFVFVQAGVDPLASDRLGRLAVTRAGLFERDRLVLAALLPEAPVVLTLGGGYARPIEDTIAAHVGTYRAARAVERELRLSPPGSGAG